jgi:hypothetical protein
MIFFTDHRKTGGLQILLLYTDSLNIHDLLFKNSKKGSAEAEPFFY